MRPEMLSKRLQTVADMVTRGNRVCDVGCDHGYVSIYLVKQGISPGVLAMDVRKGPLSAAKEHVAEQDLSDLIETRLSDGLHNYNIGEAQSLICAGMGGRLMRQILEEEKDKADSFRELILQPQSEIEEFRCFLRENAYLIQDEEILEEDGKFYQVMRAVPAERQKAGAETVLAGRQTVAFEAMMLEKQTVGEHGTVCSGNETVTRIRWTTGQQVLPEDKLCKLEDRYGSVNLNKKTSVLLSYLSREEQIYMEILENLRQNGLSDERRKTRFAQVKTLLRDCRKVLALLYG